jgi:hypothetical protein
MEVVEILDGYWLRLFISRGIEKRVLASTGVWTNGCKEMECRAH